MMGLTLFLVPLFLIIMGILIRVKKASYLIAGFNTSSKEEQNKYDKDAICKFVGNLLFVLAGILLIIAFLDLFNVNYFNYFMNAGFIIFIVIAIGAVIYMNTGNRFKKE